MFDIFGAEILNHCTGLAELEVPWGTRVIADASAVYHVVVHRIIDNIELIILSRHNDVLVWSQYLATHELAAPFDEPNRDGDALQMPAQYRLRLIHREL